MTNAKELPSQEYLKECFDYDEETGNLIWKERPLHHFNTEQGMRVFNSSKVNKFAESIHHTGYKVTNITNKGQYLVHRIIWKLLTGKDPEGQIDHINNDPLDNRIENLRDVTTGENQQNKRHFINNTSGHKGVYWDTKALKWFSKITRKGHVMRLGYFKNKEDAIKTRLEAEEKDWSHLETKSIIPNTVIDLAYIKNNFRYDDGYLYDNKGNKLGTATKSGYIRVSIKRKSFMVHRVIFSLCNDMEISDSDVIDHINGVRDDNRIENLRLVTPTENAINKKIPINNIILNTSKK